MSTTYLQKQFAIWYRKWRNTKASPAGRFDYPAYFHSAQDYVKRFDDSRNFKKVAYDWNPSPITSETAKELRERLERVVITERLAA